MKNSYLRRDDLRQQIKPINMVITTKNSRPIGIIQASYID